MAIDLRIQRSRRALLAGSMGGAAVLVASAIGRPLSARAADGETVLVGGEYKASSVTRLDTGTTGQVALSGKSASNTGVDGWSDTQTGVHGWSSTFCGVYGESPSGDGVYGWSDSVGVHGECSAGSGVLGQSTSGIGVRGQSATGDGMVASSGGSAKSGVYGYSTNQAGFGVFGRNKGTGATGALGAGVAGVVGSSPAASGIVGTSGGASAPASAQTGVHGYAIQSASARGVHGQTTIGRGVYGQATSGVGIYGFATTGYALRAVGRVKLDKCAGLTTIAAGSDRVTVTPGIDLVATSAVVATLQGSAGSTSTAVSRVTVDTATNKFVIILTKAATQSVKVAWHVFG